MKKDKNPNQGCFSPEEKYFISQKIIWDKQKELCPNTDGDQKEKEKCRTGRK